MKYFKLVLIAFLVTITFRQVTAQQTLQLGTPALSFDTFTNAVANGTAYALPVQAVQCTWVTAFGTAPDAITILLQTSLDNSTWNTLDTSTSVTAVSRNVNTSAGFIRARISAVTAGTTTTVSITCKAGFIATGSPTLSTLTVTNIVLSGTITGGDLTYLPSLYSGAGSSLTLKATEGGGEQLLFTVAGFTEYNGDNNEEFGSVSAIDATNGGLYFYGVASGATLTPSFQFQSRFVAAPDALTPHFFFVAGAESVTGHVAETLFAVDNDWKKDDPTYPRYPFQVYEIHGDIAGGFSDSVVGLGVNVVPGAVTSILQVKNPPTGQDDVAKAYVVGLIEGRADQTADLLDFKLTGGSVLTSVSAAGYIVAPRVTARFITSGATAAVTNTSANSCGTTAATIAGNDNAGKVTVGATSGTSCTVTFTAAYANAPSCVATNETTANVARAVSTTTTVILSGVFVAGDVVSYACLGR